MDAASSLRSLAARARRSPASRAARRAPVERGLLLLLLPFYFYEREGDGSLDLLPGGDAVDTLVIIASHPRQVKWEFERAFRDYYRAKHGREVRIDWRDVGGTSDAANYIDSRFASEFRNYYDANYPGEWSAAAAAGFNDAALFLTMFPATRRKRRRAAVFSVGCIDWDRSIVGRRYL